MTHHEARSERPRVATVTLNPAIDVTYEVPSLVVDDVVRVTRTTSRAGGKGVNVAAVASAIGADARVLVLTGGPSGTAFTDGLAALDLDVLAVDALADVRRTVVVVAHDGTTTSLQEPGHDVREPQTTARQVLEAVDRLLAEGVSAVAVSGSLPPGCPVSLLTDVVARFLSGGVPVVVDTSGEALASVVRSGAILTPNRSELVEMLGESAPEPFGANGLDEAWTVAAARRLLSEGAPAVLVTLGADGILAVTPDGTFAARPPQAVFGNPTGAGDAAVAALLVHLAAAGDPAAVRWTEALADMVATSAACVLRPVAGEVDHTARAAWLPQVRVRATTPPTDQEDLPT
ncbi:1-phosphofructokinase family hexose kinase [Sanguibacter antarcticus]|uniref:1-phosphofructokinase/tagatose 6-phosphate kinase n=1 Tax=Sanguibacter antarcticus TaxID=372484 RepID=A0A2A9E9H7_9MICO|nr:hexose kinase [Sanguibacter antarcticus]PFG34892.1 1-phosphofructokinase/tagatose 6-phosphate kinase [Sanguibacter antarcticus]